MELNHFDRSNLIIFGCAIGESIEYGNEDEAVKLLVKAGVTPKSAQEALKNQG